MKKDLRKAVKICDYLILAHYKNAENIEEMVKDWGADDPGELGKVVAETHKEVARYIDVIKMCILGECIHPKKMQDTTKNGQKYCMQCNNDLD